MISKLLIAALSVFGIAGVVTTAVAYDAETHGLIAYQAFYASDISKTGPGSVKERVGLDRLDAAQTFNIYWQPNGPGLWPVAYYDNTTTFDRTTYPRQPTEYERCQMQHLTAALFPPAKPINWLFGDPMLYGGIVINHPIENWLMLGDLREDDITPLGYRFATETCGQPDVDPWGVLTRVTNHFYDPIHDVPLADRALFFGKVGKACTNGGYNGKCAKSVDWALGYLDSFATPPVVDTNRRNHFTYADARENMWRALTGESGRTIGAPYTAAARADDAQERLFRWATTFRSLGDVIHLLQDGAQPQHVRNDDHSPFTSGEQQAYEGYTNARVIGTGDAKLSSYVRGFFAQPSQLTVPLVVTGNYQPVMFSTALRFFTTRNGGEGADISPDNRFGLMDYTNRGFFTGGTRPGSADGNSFPEPPSPTIAAYTTIKQPCIATEGFASRITNLTCTHLMYPVWDSVRPGYPDELPHAPGQASAFTQPPLLTFSTWKDILPGSPFTKPDQGYAVGLEEFQTMANLAIPRAIGYSAGLINYFFRGQLTVTAPADGIYAIVNHGTPHTVSDGYPICSQTVVSPVDGKTLCTANGIFGFTSVRLNVQNTTAAATESGTNQPISKATGGTNAKMVAVVRYHRNPCYQPDLSGEPSADSASSPHTPINCSSPRTAYQEISVSAEIPVVAALLDGQNPVYQVFDFSNDPIPINATDVFVQVAYRGPLGAETDGIAVGMVDVSEPTYLSLFNSTDYEWKNNDWQIPTGNDPPSVPFTGIQICSGPWQIYDLPEASGQQLPVTHALRLGALRDFSSQPYKMSIASAQGNYAVGGQATTWQGRKRQALDEKGTGYDYDPMFYGRGMVVSDYTQSPHVIVGITLPTDAQYLTYWDKPVLQPEASENVGTVMQPGTKDCTF